MDNIVNGWYVYTHAIATVFVFVFVFKIDPQLAHASLHEVYAIVI